ncbi:hypothetical protein [Halapricum desulfuricans]|uniref:Beta-galactosidase C-terminal domain-containing protein n=1 Tax=Halapricum desulfuricans TaxID=2841257 RepID=A0A897N358_9EURY|nr:hypothetical protein [Halapricum desulfuricans]QSG07117.1 hypothetical protein HSR121_2797 [Halapricum desulfuricans]
MLVVLNFERDAATVPLPDGTTDPLTDIDASEGDGVRVEHAVVLRADEADL